MNVASSMLDSEGITTVQLLQQYFSVEPKVIFDIGACVGLFSLHMAKKHPNATIFSFEPIPESYEIFSKNIAINGINNIIAINKGLYSEQMKVTLSLPRPETLSPHVLQDDGMPGLGRYTMFSDPKVKLDGVKPEFISDWKDGVKTVEAEMTTINDITSEYNIISADIIKIDCEGAERDIINNSKDFFKHSKIVFAEHHPQFDKDDKLSQTLQELSYECVTHTGLNKFWVNRGIKG